MTHVDTAINVLEQIHDGKTHMSQYLKCIFKDFPVGIGWLDRNSVIQDCNQFAADSYAKTHPDFVIGRTSLDLAVKEIEALNFMAEDREVFNTGKPLITSMQPFHRTKDQRLMLQSVKIPIYGSCGNILSLVVFWSNIDQLQEPLRSQVSQLSNKHMNDMCQVFKNTQSYYLVTGTQTVRLTARQAECLTHLSMGKTIKQVASMLDCSSRTIEDHVNLLKRKLGVCSTAQLIDCFWRNPIKWF